MTSNTLLTMNLSSDLLLTIYPRIAAFLKFVKMEMTTLCLLPKGIEQKTIGIGAIKYLGGHKMLHKMLDNKTFTEPCGLI